MLIKRICLKEYKRIIMVSDIHGELNLFDDLLQKVGFSADDALVIVGDLTEKGDRSLETLRYVMSLKEGGNVFAVMGNNDYITTELDDLSEKANSAFLEYLMNRKGLIRDMCAMAHIDIDSDMNIIYTKRYIKEKYKDELTYIMSLPIIIESEEHIFVHAGIENKPLDQQDIDYCLNVRYFFNKYHGGDKWCIVGHHPSALYFDDIIYNGIIKDDKRKIITIDGGNVIKRFGQLNALVYDNETKEYSWTSTSYYPYVKALDDQNEEKGQVIRWPDNEVEVCASDGSMVLIRTVKDTKVMRVPDIALYTIDGRTYCDDITDGFPAVRSGDMVRLLYQGDDICLISHNDHVGFYKGRISVV